MAGAAATQIVDIEAGATLLPRPPRKSRAHGSAVASPAAPPRLGSAAADRGAGP